MSGRARVVALCVAVSLTPSAAACSGSGHSTPAASSSASSSNLVATRWWSNSAATEGTTIDVTHPQALAAKLRESRTDYCGMLKQTVAAGKSILPGVTAGDPALLASTKAFMTELTRVAPASLASSWRELSDVVVALVASDGDVTKVQGIDAKAVQGATSAIAADAKRNCRVDLSAVAH